MIEKNRNINSSTLILASKSPRRINFFKEMQLSFIDISANLDESRKHYYPLHISVIHAIQKAKLVSRIYPDNFVIGVDTVVEFEDNILGKPANIYDAEETLLSLSGKTHHVVSSVCIIKMSDFTFCTFSEQSIVKFKNFDIETVREYYTHVNPLDKAGGYAIQEHGKMIVEHIRGSKDNIIGLPTEKLKDTFVILKII